MTYELYETALPRLSIWQIEDWRELEDVYRSLTTDTEHRYWWRGKAAIQERKWEEIDPTRLLLDLNPDDPVLWLKDPVGGTYSSIATGSCCVVTSTNGTGFVSMYRMGPDSMPGFLFHPAMHLLP